MEKIIEKDYNIPDFFEWNPDEKKAIFLNDSIITSTKVKHSDGYRYESLAIPYFAIKSLVDCGEYLEITILMGINTYEKYKGLFENDIIKVYFEYKVDKDAVIEHYNSLNIFWND